MALTNSVGFLRPMLNSDLATVLAWRNHPKIREWMYTRQNISVEEHARWFENAQLDTSKTLLIYEEENISSGFLNFKELNSGGIAEWGFYVAPYAPKGTGSRMGALGLDYAFNVSRLKKVFGQVLGFNERSIKYHERLGFQTEGILRAHHFDGTTYTDIYCFGLLKQEWRSPDYSN